MGILYLKIQGVFAFSPKKENYHLKQHFLFTQVARLDIT